MFLGHQWASLAGADHWGGACVLHMHPPGLAGSWQCRCSAWLPVETSSQSRNGAFLVPCLGSAPTRHVQPSTSYDIMGLELPRDCGPLRKGLARG